jgi:hypothetical protein
MIFFNFLLDHIELMFEKEYAKQLESFSNTVVNECRQIDNVLKKEIQDLKQRFCESYRKEHP